MILRASLSSISVLVIANICLIAGAPSNSVSLIGAVEDNKWTSFTKSKYASSMQVSQTQSAKVWALPGEQAKTIYTIPFSTNSFTSSVSPELLQSGENIFLAKDYSENHDILSKSHKIDLVL